MVILYGELEIWKSWQAENKLLTLPMEFDSITVKFGKLRVN
jgi:hypothetical protein